LRPRSSAAVLSAAFAVVVAAGAGLGVATTLGGCSTVQEFDTELDPSVPDGPPTVTGGETVPAAPRCTAGQCKPRVIAEGQGLDPNDPDRQGPWAIASDDAFVYWMTVWSEIYRLPRSGGTPEMLAQTEAVPYLLRLSGGYLYFTSVPDRRILRIPKQGGPAEPVTPSSHEETGQVLDFVVEGGAITWIDGLRVLRCESVPCEAPTELRLNDSHWRPASLARSEGHTFVGTWEEGAMSDGFGIVVPDEGSIVSIPYAMYTFVRAQPDPSRPGWTAIYGATDDMLVRADYPGSLPAKVLASGDEVEGVAMGLTLDGDYVYWIDRGARCATGDCAPRRGQVKRVLEDGSEKPEVVAGELPMLNDMFVTADAIYLTSSDGTVLAMGKPAGQKLR
jgi:hypothetical protein